MEQGPLFWNRRLQLLFLDDDDELMLDDMIFDSDTEFEEDDDHRGGSLPGKAPNIDRKRHVYSKLLLQDYFTDNPTYSAAHFRRRFRMRISLLKKLSTT